MIPNPSGAAIGVDAGMPQARMDDAPRTEPLTPLTTMIPATPMSPATPVMPPTGRTRGSSPRSRTGTPQGGQGQGGQSPADIDFEY